MYKRITAYRIVVVVLALLCIALAIAEYVGNMINAFYFPRHAKNNSSWTMLGLALLAVILFAEAFLTALPKALRREP
ncbi:hypothetical protein ACWA7J_02765 [Leptothrix sp. BB-4]